MLVAFTTLGALPSLWAMAGAVGPIGGSSRLSEPHTQAICAVLMSKGTAVVTGYELRCLIVSRNGGENDDRAETAAAERWNERPESRHDAVAVDLLNACVADDEDAASAMMAASVVLFVDGGGKVCAPTEPVVGTRQVARFVLELGAGPEMVVRPGHINGQTGLAFHRQGRVVGVLSFLIGRGGISDIWIVLNPDKLRRWNPRQSHG